MCEMSEVKCDVMLTLSAELEAILTQEQQANRQGRARGHHIEDLGGESYL